MQLWVRSGESIRDADIALQSRRITEADLQSAGVAENKFLLVVKGYALCLSFLGNYFFLKTKHNCRNI